MNRLALIGNGGHAREVELQMGFKLTKFVDDQFYIDGDPYLFPISKFDPEMWDVMIAISDTSEREKMVTRMPIGTKYFSFIHPSAIVSDDLCMGDGTFIGAYSIVTTNVKLGNHCILNRACQIGHDSEIQDYLSAMPGSIVSGNVKIGNRVFIGSNSSIREKIKICDDVVIGLNSGIYQDINLPGRYSSIKQEKF